jgi:hypothetical protein
MHFGNLPVRAQMVLRASIRSLLAALAGCATDATVGDANGPPANAASAMASVEAPSTPEVSASAAAPGVGPATSATPTPSSPPCPEPQRAVDVRQVKSVSTATTGCKRLPTQKALAKVPDYVVETRCAGPEAATVLEVNEEDGRAFFAVTRAGAPRVQLDPITPAFNSAAGAARWYRLGDGPVETIVIPIRSSHTDDAGKQVVETFLAAWDLRSGRICRTTDVTQRPQEVTRASDELARLALARDCDCRARP